MPGSARFWRVLARLFQAYMGVTVYKVTGLRAVVSKKACNLQCVFRVGFSTQVPGGFYTAPGGSWAVVSRIVQGQARLGMGWGFS